MTLFGAIRNFMNPGYGSCYKCGGNWGWKKGVTHMTDKGTGIFLFCKECDKAVTLKERHEALDEWKNMCISQLNQRYATSRDDLIEIQAEIRRIQNTEFIEFPRNKEKEA